MKRQLLTIAAAFLLCTVAGCSQGGAGAAGSRVGNYSAETSGSDSQSASQTQQTTQQNTQPGSQNASFRPEVEMTEDEAACWEPDDGMVYVPEYTRIMGEGEYDISADTGYFVNGDKLFSLGHGVVDGVHDFSHLAVHSADLITGEKLQDIKEDGILNYYARTADGYIGYSLSVSPLVFPGYDCRRPTND